MEQNIGVSVLGEDGRTYYNLLTRIFELQYYNGSCYVLFKCNWVDLDIIWLPPCDFHSPNIHGWQDYWWFVHVVFLSITCILCCEWKKPRLSYLCSGKTKIPVWRCSRGIKRRWCWKLLWVWAFQPSHLNTQCLLELIIMSGVWNSNTCFHFYRFHAYKHLINSLVSIPQPQLIATDNKTQALDQETQDSPRSTTGPEA